MPASLAKYPEYFVPLRPYNLTGIENIRKLLNEHQEELLTDELNQKNFPLTSHCG